MKHLLISVFLLMAGMVTVNADNITVNGTNRSYNVYAPKNLGENRPLLIFCHGYNQDANWMQNSEFKNDNVSMESVCDTANSLSSSPTASTAHGTLVVTVTSTSSRPLSKRW